MIQLVVALMLVALGHASQPSPNAEPLGEHAEAFHVVWWRPFEQGSPWALGAGLITPNGALVVVTDDGHIHAIDASLGVDRWSSVMLLDSSVRPVATNTGVAVADSNGRVVCLRDDDGLASWSVALPGRCDVLGADGSTVFAASGVTLHAIEPSGQVRWRVDLDQPVAAVQAGNGACVVSGTSGLITALDVATGDVRWRFDAEKSVGNRLVLKSGAVYAVTEHEVVWSLALDTGGVRWSHQLSGRDPWPDPMFVSRAPLFVAGDLLFVTGNAWLYNMRVFSCSTGRLLYSDSIEAVPSETGFGVVGTTALLAMTCTGRNLLVFDLGRRLIAGRFALPDHADLIGVWRNSFVFRSERGVFAARPLPSLRELPPTLSTVSAPKIRKCLWWVSMVGSLSVVSLALAVHTGRTLAPTAFVRLRFWITVLTSASLSGVCLWAAIVFVSAASRGSGGAGSWLFATALLGPPVALVWSFARHALGGARLTPASYRAAARECGRIARIVRHLRIEMRVRHPIMLKRARAKGAPSALPRAFGRAAIAVPGDLERIALRSTGDDVRLADSLLRFVLAHELAHVLHRDLWVLPLARACGVSRRGIGPFAKAALLVVVLYLAIRLFGLDKPVEMLGGPIVMTLAAGTVLLALAVLLLRVDQERLADATATLAIGPEEVGRLTTPALTTGKDLPPLGQFMVSLAVRGLEHRSYLGFARRSTPAEPGLLGMITKRLRETGEKRHLLPVLRPDIGASAVGAIWSAAMGAVFFCSIACAWLYMFGFMLVDRTPPGADLSTNVLESMSAFSRWATQDVNAPQTTKSVATALCGMFLGAAATLPFVPRLRGELLHRQAGVSQLAGQVLGCVVLFLLLSGFLQGWIHVRDLPVFDAIRISALPVVGWMLVTVFLQALFAMSAGNTRVHSASILVRESLGLLSGVVVAMACAGILLQGLVPLERFLWSFNLVGILFWIANWAPVKRLAGFQLLTGERARVTWFLGLRRVRPLLVARGNRPASDGIVIDSVITSFGLLVLPAVVLAGLLQPWLLRENAEFYAGEFQAIRAAPESTLTLAAQVYMRPGRASPVIVDGLLVSVGLTVLLAVRAWAPSAAKLNTSLRTVRQGAALARLERMTGRSLTPSMPPRAAERLREVVTRLARRRRLGSGPPYNILWCRLACDGAACATLVGIDPSSREALSLRRFISSCAAPSGGLGARPRAPADLWHTACSIEILGDALTSADVHAAYLVRQARMLARNVATTGPAQWLEMTALTVGALARLGRLNDVAALDQDRLARAAADVWRRSFGSVAETCHVLRISAAMSPQVPGVLRRAELNQLADLDRWLLQASPASLELAVDVVGVLAVYDSMGFMDRPSVAHLIDNLFLTLCK